MTDFKKKYLKYKLKYVNLSIKNIRHTQIGANDNVRILLHGTSSAGKSAISEYFKKDGYMHVSNDDYGRDGAIKFNETLPNEYITRADLFEKGSRGVREYMYDQSKHNSKVVYDDIDQYILLFDPDVYTVIIHAPLDDLVRNIIARKKTSPRGMNVFRQFAKLYTVSDNDHNIENISKVNRAEFIRSLKDNFKSEFDNEENLIEFANKIFSDLGITDDMTHWVGLRSIYKYDLIINTQNKNPKDIYEEILNKFK